MILETMLVNDIASLEDVKLFAFLPEKPLFATDKCAPHHMYNNSGLFIGVIKEIANVSIRGAE